MALKTLGKQVEEILENSIECRNSDRILTWTIWETYYGVEHYIGIGDFIKLPSQANIQRMRAKIQNSEHRLLPTNPDVVKKRRISENVWIEYMRA